MTKHDLRLEQVWVSLADGTEREVICLAVAGCGDSIAWRGADGAEGGGSAEEFIRTHAPRVMGWMVPHQKRRTHAGPA